MDDDTARRRLADARVARLATVTSDVRPHVVPCCFVLAHDTVYSVVDAKPKSTLALRRLKNIKANAAASVLVDHYDEAWETLWWVRVDGRGRVVAGVTERERALEMLAVKYPQYRSAPPPGEVLAVDIDRWRAWP